jgi:hypothetical protein
VPDEADPFTGRNLEIDVLQTSDNDQTIVFAVDGPARHAAEQTILQRKARGVVDGKINAGVDQIYANFSTHSQ